MVPAEPPGRFWGFQTRIFPLGMEAPIPGAIPGFGISPNFEFFLHFISLFQPFPPFFFFQGISRFWSRPSRAAGRFFRRFFPNISVFLLLFPPQSSDTRGFLPRLQRRVWFCRDFSIPSPPSFPAF